MLFWHFFRHLIISRRAGALIRRISFLSMGAIFLSVAAFILILCVMNGMNHTIRDRVMGVEPHLTFLSDSPADGQRPQVQEFLKNQASQEGVEAAFFESQDVIVRSYEGQFRGVVARGMDVDGIHRLMQRIRGLKKHADPAEVLWAPEEEILPGEVIIGLDFARGLNLFEGDPITLFAPESLLLPPGETPITEKLRVKKIVSTNIADLDSQLFIYRRGESLKGLLRQGVGSHKAGLELRMANGLDAESYKKNLQLPEGLKAETWAERNSALFFALRMEKTAIGIFLALAGLVAGSSILTVMALLLSQKRRDLALLRVLGLAQEESVRLFTKVGLVLSGFGVGCGVLVGFAVAFWIQENPLNVLPEYYYDAEIPSRLDPPLILLTPLIAMGLAWLGSWIPARTLTHLEPVDVLKAK